jgi:uncharacterized hydrophobic protein (TIGR00271 family)
VAAPRQAFGETAAVRATIDSISGFDAAFVTMNALATVLACYGLFENSPAVVIGAMLLGPISGVALGLVDANNRLLRKALATLAGGVAVVYGTAFILGLVHSTFPLTNEIYARTSPNLMDLMIALSGGAAGAYAIVTPRLNLSLVGVAISTALVPPLSSSAICMARGEYRLGLGALLLAFANIVGISGRRLRRDVALRLSGRGCDAGRERIEEKLRQRRYIVPSRGPFDVESAQADYKRSLRGGCTQGSHVRDRCAQGGLPCRCEISARQRAQHCGSGLPHSGTFYPTRGWRDEQKLPLKPGTQGLELRIRSIPVAVASKNGYLYSSEELTEY